tara:strand:- start:684 stop:893 length:210 start_codon:yes stop_codon:yes gene_type:complete
MSVNMDDIPEDKTKELLNDMLHRIESLEERVARLPCDHVGFPIDEGYDLDEDDFEIRVETCRNCGERVL